MTPTEPATTPVDRLHVAMREPVSTHGGVHSYVRTLTAGQRSLGLTTRVADEVTRFGGSPAWTPGVDQLAGHAVVHLHFAHAGRPWLRNRAHRRESAQARAATVFHFHGPWADEAALHGDSRAEVAFKRLYERDTYRRIRAFVAASEAFADILSRQYGVDAGRIRVLAPAVDTDAFPLAGDDARAAARTRLGLPLGAGPVYLAVRRLEHRMGLDLAIRAVGRLGSGTLVVAGTGSRELELRHLARTLRLEDRVRFLGPVPDADLSALYAAADVVVVPSRGLEGFGIVVLEAMATGRPVVATRVGGLPSATGPFAGESLVPADQVEALATAMARQSRSSTDPLLYRAYAESRGPQATARLLEEHLVDLLGAHGRAARVRRRA